MSSTTTTTTLTERNELVDQSSVPYKLRATSTWINKPFRQRNLFEHLAAIDLASKKCYEIQPKNVNAPPTHNIWIERLWLLFTIPPALIIQYLWYHFVPEDKSYHTWHPLFAYVYYVVAFFIFTVMLVNHIHHYMDLYGTFDEHKRPRDYVPDKMVTRLVLSVLVYMLARTGGGLFLGGYNRYVSPSLGGTISWFVIIKIGVWLVVLDFFFYCYHRACHQVPFLWKIHSLHHCTKHPTPIQSILAGDIQEIIEIFLIPLAASLIVPMTAHEFWIGQCILIYVEAAGHSGIRAYWPHVILFEVTQPFGMELCIEDHDLHHRYGKSGKKFW